MSLYFSFLHCIEFDGAGVVKSASINYDFHIGYLFFK